MVRIAIVQLHEYVEDARSQKGGGGKINFRFAVPLSRCNNDGNLAALLVNHFIVEHGGENDGHP